MCQRERVNIAERGVLVKDRGENSEEDMLDMVGGAYMEQGRIMDHFN